MPFYVKIFDMLNLKKKPDHLLPRQPGYLLKDPWLSVPDLRQVWLYLNLVNMLVILLKLSIRNKTARATLW